MKRRELVQFYLSAKQSVIAAGFEHEVIWISETAGLRYSERDLLREAAWVILCSGFREVVVRARFSYISLCFCDWESAGAIVNRGAVCIQAAKHAFANIAKLAAIFRIAELVTELGFEAIRRRIDSAPLEQLKRFPYIGGVTAEHLAKNLGYPFAKNDRHLNRLAQWFEFPDGPSLCERLAAISGDTVPVVDTVLWRFYASKLTLQPKTMRQASLSQGLASPTPQPVHTK